MQQELPTYIQTYLEFLQNDGKTLSTIEQYRSNLRKFHSWITYYKKDGQIELNNISKSDFQDYFDFLHSKKYSDATIRKIATVLNNMLKYHKLPNHINLNKLASAEPLRNLVEDDFISKEQFRRLRGSLEAREGFNNGIHSISNLSARDYLIERNLSIILLIRSHGLTPSQISAINMSDINFVQRELRIKTLPGIVLSLDKYEAKYIYEYYKSIPTNVRPLLHSDNPLFVAFNNTSMTFQFDYDNGKPKRLTERGIREMIKNEVIRAGLSNISSTHLRNSCILDHLSKGTPDDEIARLFGLSPSPSQLHYSLKRYKTYLKEIKGKDVKI